MSTELSPREREILNAIYDGRSTNEIAAAAGISENTVEWHVASTLRKLNAASRAEAVVKAYRRGILEEPPHPAIIPETYARPPRSHLIARSIARWMIAAVVIAVALVGLSGALTAAPLFRVAPIPTLSPTLVPPATTSPRP